MSSSRLKAPALKPVLVIVTTHFGTNFSGGSTATCEIFERLQERFERVVVVGTELGKHSFRHLEFKRYRNPIDAILKLREFDRASTIFYGDFFNAYLLVLARRPFLFTYHDNWPELAELSDEYRRKKHVYWPLYRMIFRKALAVVAVSRFKQRRIESYARQTILIRNGLGSLRGDLQSKPTVAIDRPRENVLMVGNLDKRKYQKAIELFDSMPEDPGFSIDIFGHVVDKDVEQKLRGFSFVRLCGYEEVVPYARYRCLLHTSLMENLSIVWCEAIASQTPVLTFDVGGASEVISNDSGCLIAPYDLMDMREQLVAWMGEPSTMPSGTLLPAEFSWDVASKRYGELIAGLYPRFSLRAKTR